ncbi:MAG: 4Fe-4S binding protein [Anaerolineales bacterium]|nr:4Fe-4S binding protein [Anaerolineales bacterium]
MDLSPFKSLAERLNALPDGFPPAKDGAELRLLQLLFTPEEAQLAAQLRLTKETSNEISSRLELDHKTTRDLLKQMAHKRLISAGKVEGGIGFGLEPFVVGIYEFQYARIDKEFAEHFEEYYQQAFSTVLDVKPQFHRVIPVNETVDVDMEVLPFESVTALIDQANAWGVLDCICRKQKEFIGDPCDHPLDVCMALNDRPGAFDGNPAIRALDRDGAFAALRRAADAGLVHSISNKQDGHWYICNCCTCSCGILRGMAEMGVANVVARSPFVSSVDEDLCTKCEICSDYCQFEAITFEEIAVVDRNRCVGCGLCALHCPDEAMTLERRPSEEVLPVPETISEWRMDRAAARGINMDDVL